MILQAPELPLVVMPRWFPCSPSLGALAGFLTGQGRQFQSLCKPHQRRPFTKPQSFRPHTATSLRGQHIPALLVLYWIWLLRFKILNPAKKKKISWAIWNTYGKSQQFRNKLLYDSTSIMLWRSQILRAITQNGGYQRLGRWNWELVFNG